MCAGQGLEQWYCKISFTCLGLISRFLLEITLFQILDSSELKQFVDDNFKIYENGRQLSKQVENPVGKGEITYQEPFLLLPQCFQETCTADM